MRGSPKGARKSGGLDFEVEGRCEEVQKGREGVADWTLRWRGGRRKSKRGEKERRIGLCSSGEAGGSPKGARRSGGLDFEVEGRCEEVQKEREGAVDWTLKRRGGRRKSKRGEKERRIGL